MKRDGEFEEARRAAYEAVAQEMFAGKPGRWTGSGPGNVTEAALDAFLTKLSERYRIVPIPTGDTRDHEWEDHCGDIDCEICAPRF